MLGLYVKKFNNKKKKKNRAAASDSDDFHASRPDRQAAFAKRQYDEHAARLARQSAIVQERVKAAKLRRELPALENAFSAPVHDDISIWTGDATSLAEIDGLAPASLSIRDDDDESIAAHTAVFSTIRPTKHAIVRQTERGVDYEAVLASPDAKTYRQADGTVVTTTSAGTVVVNQGQILTMY